MAIYELDIDHYKLKTFERELTAAGYPHKVSGGYLNEFIKLLIEVPDTEVGPKFQTIANAIHCKASH